MTALCALHIGVGLLRPDLDPTALYLTVPDARGTYTLPYLQSSRRLDVSVDFADPSVAKVELSLRLGGRVVAKKTVPRDRPTAAFADLVPGEYALEGRGRDRHGKELFRTRVIRVGVGTVLAALGDSITEGYYGHGFHRDENLTAADFPPEAVSRDGRNFPQFSPTTAVHLPAVNCFQSWMTDLNDSLAAAWRHPVFIANEGWGGYTTAAYLNLMQTDRNWQERMQLLRPQLWLIHLGVNDERAHEPAEAVARNLEAMVRLLIDRYGASVEHILLARPSYDYAEGAEPILAAYCAAIDALVSRLHLQPGPDFHAAYAQDKQRWYGDDPVHPNVDGMRRMAELWSEAIVKAIPEGP